MTIMRSRVLEGVFRGICFVIVLSFGSNLAAAPTLTATLDRNTVPVGESVTLSLTFEGVTPQAAPRLPQLPTVRASWGGESSQYTIINGRTTALKTYTYSLVPTQPGDVQIPSFRVAVGNTVLSTPVLQLKVLPANAAEDPSQALGNLAFLRLNVPKTEVYMGESFPVEMQLYWQNGRDIRTPQLKADGFSLSPNPQHTQTRTQVGNAIYNRLVFQLAVTPARAGDLTLGPAECDMTLLIPMTNRRGQDLFDLFGGRAQARSVTLKSDPVTMKVLPLPSENVPESFSGAVGQFALRVTVGPTNVSVGDPITIEARISGRGLLDAVNLPDQSQWRDFKLYPATSRVESNDPLGLSGVKVFEQVVIPQNHEVKSLPSLLFSYFDPGKKLYQTLSNAPTALQVRHASQIASPLPVLTNANDQAKAPVDDILHIKPRLDGLIAVQTSLMYRPWFLVLQGVPALLWLGLFGMRKRAETLAGNPKLRRQRLVAQKVREGIKEMHALAEEQKPEEFFAVLFRLLQEQLGERLDLSASAITEAVIDDRLLGCGLKEGTLQALHELFQTCNQARYAAQKSTQELEAMMPRIESVLGELQQIKA